MGGNLSCFGSAGSGYRDIDDQLPAAYDQPRPSSRKVRPSNEDRLWYVGEPDVDRQAEEFITKFTPRSTRFVEA